jgi:ATP-dependent DNA ligase
VGGAVDRGKDEETCQETLAQIEFLEWTDADHLRHSKFVGLREDKDPRTVVKESAGEV